MTDDVDIKGLLDIIRNSDGNVFSDDNIAIIIDRNHEEVASWNEEAESIDVNTLIDGEWSLTEPEDGDYGSIVLEDFGGMDMVKDDFGLGDKGRHRFRKLF